MGLTIHYTAQLKSVESLPILVSEVADLCKSMGWNYTLYPQDENEDESSIRGISVHLNPDGEPLWLTFSPAGRLTTPFSWQMRNRYPEFSFKAFTKTQFAGPHTHMILVHLLKYLSGKYFASVEVSDEGGYWETEDVSVLRDRFETYIDVFTGVFDVLETLPAVPDESVVHLAKRIGRALEGMTTRYADLRKET